MAFLGDLAGQINSQFNLGSNNTTSLNSIIDGQQSQQSNLGDFQFDQSAERKYLESGYLRIDPYQTNPYQFNILWQEPQATVLLKKRMFSSIAENYRADYMDADEKLYYNAMKVLFTNKCNEIASLEQLSKIQKITAAVGNVSEQLFPYILTLSDTLSSNPMNNPALAGTSPLTTQDGTSFIQAVNRIRTVQAFNQTNPYTTWITNPTSLFQSNLGNGTGVIELTNFTSITTSTNIDLKSPGTFNFSIVDPYGVMRISEYDIEIAISDATNLFYNNKAFQFSLTTSNQIISQQQNQLNSLRNSRGACPIEFNVQSQTLLNVQPLITIIQASGLEIPYTYDSTGGTGIPGLGGFGTNNVNVPADYLINGNLAGYNGLDTFGSNGNSELNLYQSIVVAIYQQIQLLSNSSGTAVNHNKNTNYARKKLRFNFLGKLIIQPMDTVHIYMSSKSQYDNKVLAGLTQMFSGFGILQNINNTVTSINNSYDTLFNPSGNIAVAAEKAMYVGSEFPNYLWALVRSQFVSEKEGSHVFAGLVDSAVLNWNNGKYTIDVNGKDNTAYFDQGKVNFKPGVDNFNGLIYDPLTPFVSNYDSIVVNSVPNSLQFLPENQIILGDIPSKSMVKYKLGSLVGEKATASNYLQDHTIDPNTGRITKVYYAPDGLVYRWKQGIGIFTQFGAAEQLNDANLVGNPNIYREPFAGLDAMNVISLLITGIPYNFATFYKATANLNGFNNDPQSGQNSISSFISSLQNDLSKNNSLWGNFIPFKNLTMNESYIAQAYQAQASVSISNQDLDTKLKKLSDLVQAANAINSISSISTGTANSTDPTLQNQLSALTTQVTYLQQDINTTIGNIQTANATYSAQVDNSAAYNSNYLINGKNDPADSSARKQLRRSINYLTRRMSYDVRANQDKNLFIVDDYYDIDYDIQAFNTALENGAIAQYSNDFTSVREKLTNVADLLNLEVFCDTQGHIRVRQPQYNRMPSSVFYRMLYLKQTTGVQVFPQFLNNLMTDQLQSLQQTIEIVEDKIRLSCALLNNFNTLDSNGDSQAQSFINSNNITGGQSALFSFLSNGASDKIAGVNNLIKAANQQDQQSAIAQAFPNYTSLVNTATSTKQLFTNAERYLIISQSLQVQNLAVNGQNANSSVFNFAQSTIIQQLITRIKQNSGQQIVSADYITAYNPTQPATLVSNQVVDVFKVTNDLMQYMNQWQNAVKQFYHAVKNFIEYKSLDTSTTSSATNNTIQAPGVFNNNKIPEVYEHMIEDETYDDYGLNSGQRYVIKDAQIISMSISENAPPFTAVQVQGVLPYFAEGEGTAPGLNAFPGGGNAQVTAMALDYDLWRNYGFKNVATLTVPFLTDPETQCGPYASMVLTRNRFEILRGSVTISGNEYQQPGEVVYIESLNLLFYINSVRHSLQEGRNFTTTLELCYGHSIGDYIPTYLDSIGKLFYKNKENVDIIVQRQDTAANEQNLGVIQTSSQQPTASIIDTGNNDTSSNNPYAVSNSQVINNILYNAAAVINNNGVQGNNSQAALEIRIYYDNNARSANINLQQQATTLINVLTGNNQGPTTNTNNNQPVQNNTIDAKWVSIVLVNLDDEIDPRSPSQKAIDAARNQLVNASTNTGNNTNSNNSAQTSTNNISPNNQTLRTALFNSIIDCWITFTQVPSNIANNTTNNGTSNSFMPINKNASTLSQINDAGNTSNSNTG